MFRVNTLPPTLRWEETNEVFRQDVSRLLKDLYPWKAQGPNEIPVKVLKESVETLERPLEMFRN